MLITDRYGADLLVERLGLEFIEVSTDLETLSYDDPNWWVLGKLFSYRAMQTPFIHIDSDVFLWRPLPSEITSAPIFAQNPEQFTFGQGVYRPDRWEEAVRAVGGNLPEEWLWYTRRQGNVAVCCGILGGNEVEFIGQYADRAIHMIKHCKNQIALSSSTEKLGSNILIEQYFLAGYINYHKFDWKSSFCGIDIKYLFSSIDDSIANAAARGYTHLIAGAKKNSAIAERLESRVRKEYPEQFSKLASYLARS